MKIEEILELLESDKEILQIEEKTMFIIDIDTHKLKRAWKRVNGDFEELELDVIVSRIAKKLKDKVDAEALLKELLIAQTHPEFLLDLDERLQKPDVMVKSKPTRCYSLSIGGKRGRPVELTLVHNQGFDT